MEAQPVQSPLSPTAVQTPPTMHSECGLSGKCSGCLKGGLPFQKGFLTFLVLLLVGTTTALSVFLINAKREVLRMKNSPPVAASAQQAKPSTAVPAPRSFAETIALPKFVQPGKLSVEQALMQRRSRREFAETPVSFLNLSQVLFAAQGVTERATGKRTAPSARDAYPYTLYVVVRNAEGLKPGLYAYRPQTHDLGSVGLVNAGEVLTAAGVQDGAQKAPVVLVLAAAYGKSAEKMGEAAQSSTLLEGGHIGQNIYLEVESLGLSTVVMGGFDAKKVGAALQMDPAETAVYVIPLGNRALPQPSLAPLLKGVQP